MYEKFCFILLAMFSSGGMHFHYKNTTSQVSVRGFKVSVFRLRKVAYSGMTEKRQGPTEGDRLKEVSVFIELSVKRESTV